MNMNNFQGFPSETIDFLWELRMNNTKSFMDENRQRYFEVLKNPFDEFAKALCKEMELEGIHNLDYRISRINRDVRFGKDKSPYRPRRWVVVKEANILGVACKNHPVFYFELHPEGYEQGLGFYDPTPSYMKAFRNKIEGNPHDFHRIIKKISKMNEFHLIGEDYKRLPKNGLTEEIQLWYHKKQFAYIRSELINDGLFDPKLPKHLVQEWKRLLPLYEYLKTIMVQ